VDLASRKTMNPDTLIDYAVWAYDHWRQLAVCLAGLGALLAWACSNFTWVYRLTGKDGVAYRVGIAKFGGYHRRMRDYRKGRDGSTKKGVKWQKRVRWWTPTIPARVARWCGCTATNPETGEPFPGWSRWFRTVELHRTRDRAKAYETVQIRSVTPLWNEQEIPAHVKQRRRQARIAA
jgi:hypothetical protein